MEVHLKAGSLVEITACDYPEYIGNQGILCTSKADFFNLPKNAPFAAFYKNHPEECIAIPEHDFFWTDRCRYHVTLKVINEKH